MALTLKDPDDQELQARITVFGVGGAGGNAVNNMIDKNLEGVEFIAANTDAQALSHSRAPRKIQLGTGVTRGLGAGSKPDVGLSAAEESLGEIAQALEGSHMCFITAGMGGGTGTGAAPVVARIAREMGILTVGVVTKPFQFEGTRRMALAEKGVAEMQMYVDTLIVIPNQNLFQVASERTTFVEAFQMADDVLYQGVQGVTDLMVRPGMINLDFADVRSVMEEMGKAMMGTGEATGETRAIDAAEKAIANPLLDEISLKGAKGVLINITGGYDLTLFEMDEAANRIKDEVDPNALIKFGSSIDPNMEGRMRVSVVATGIDADAMAARIPMDAPRRRPVTTDPAMIAAVRGRARVEAPMAAPAPSSQANRTAEAVARVQAALPQHAQALAPTPPAPAPAPMPAPAPAPVAAVAPEPRPQPAPQPQPQPSSSYEQRLATAPSPADIRARAEEVRQRALEARARREAERVEREIPIDDPHLFELDEGSIDPGSLRAEPEPQRRAAPRAPEPERGRDLPRGAGRTEDPAPARTGLFAINKLINRVAGGPAAEPRPDRVSGVAPRRDGDDDDGDIPAFLRRQAN